MTHDSARATFNYNGTIIMQIVEKKTKGKATPMTLWGCDSFDTGKLQSNLCCTPQHKLPPAVKQEIQEQCLFWPYLHINYVLLKQSLIILSQNYHQMEPFKAIKTRVWLTAVDFIWCLAFWRAAGDFLATYTSFFFFPLLTQR